MLELDNASLANTLGCLSLLSYIATLLPTILIVVFPTIRKSQIPTYLLKYRRQIGILSFCFALCHAGLLVSKRNLDFFDLKTYEMYFHGTATFVIIALLAATSNDWSVKKLKKNWKRLHKLTYLAMVFLLWHTFGAMSNHCSCLTPLGILAMTVTILLFLRRRWMEWKKQKVKQSSQPSTMSG